MDPTRTIKQAARISTGRRLGLVGASVALATGIAFLLHQSLPHANLSLVFLTAVLLVAARAGTWPAVVVGLLSFGAYNFLFTTPYYTFSVEQRGDLATLAFFLLMAAVTGNLAVRMRGQVEQTRAAARRSAILYAFSRRLAAALSLEEVVAALSEQLQKTLGQPVTVLLAQPDGAIDPEPLPPGARQQIAALWRNDSEPVARTLLLATAGGRLGLVWFAEPLREQESARLAAALCDQAAVAIERTRLAADLEQTRVRAETEQLRAALLSSVSHDLRTPLAAIIGAGTSLRDFGDSFGPADRRELLQTVVGEAERLNRYIQNLLDMTRLGHGTLQLKRDWVDLHDLVAAALNRLHSALAPFEVRTEIAADMPLLHVHGVLLEQVLVNLLDNAARWSPEHGTILIRGAREAEAAIIEVLDQGPGIAPAEREKVFDMFYSVQEGDRRGQGTGLGLAICRGLVGAHGGSIEARGRDDGAGTRMRISLPLTDLPQESGHE